MRQRALRGSRPGHGFGGVAWAVKGGGQKFGVAEGGKAFICLAKGDLKEIGGLDLTKKYDFQWV